MTEYNLPVSFIWPETTFVRKNTIAKQIDHVISEIDEVAEAAEFTDPAPQSQSGDGIPPAMLPLFRELADLHHSLETLWRVIAEAYGWEAVQALFSWIEDKNRVRGYYSGGEGWCRNDEITSLLLSLVGLEVAKDDVCGWTDEQVLQVECWAGSVYLTASDNDDIEIPERPTCLNPYLGKA